MCHQTVGLVQAELERRGIVTVSLTMMPRITRRIRPPRALAVPYPLGFPLGEATNPELQRSILEAMLDLCSNRGVPDLVSFLPRRDAVDRFRSIE